MFGSTMLELVIGLTFFYLLLGLICTLITELISSILELRAKYLHLGIRTLLKDPVLVDQFYEHPMIESLRVNRQLPPYIPARSFALTILSLVGGSSSGTVSTSGDYSSSYYDFRHSLYLLPEDGATGRLKSILLTMVDEAQGDPHRLRTSVEIWFTSTMDRIAGMYKRHIQWLLFMVALVVTVGVNVNTVAIVQRITEEPLLRFILNTRAEALDRASTVRPFPSPSPYSSPDPGNSNLSTNIGGTSAPTSQPSPTPSFMPSPSPSPLFNLDEPRSQFSYLERAITDYPPLIGWSTRSQFPFSGGGTFRSISILVGWLITALAATMCGLFWFDVLNRIIVVRTAIKPFEERHSVPTEISGPPAL